MFQRAIVRLQNKIVLNNVSFEIAPGEQWAFIGESGAGKSVLLQTIAGKFPVNGGLVYYKFLENTRKNADALDQFNLNKFIALVDSRHHFRNLCNNTSFYYQQRYNSSDSEDAATVSTYLASVKSVNAGFWTFETVVEKLHLEPLLEKHLIKLSNGETKRLMIAAALIKNPVLLLFDNPLTGLDVKTRAEFNMLITEIAQSGITIMMATSPHEIPDAITHVCTLKNGTIEQVSLKDSFHPHTVSKSGASLNTGMLRHLLEQTALNDYNVIVGMRQVNVRYGDKHILKDIDWYIRAGERWALLGPNGAGKSTLLSLVNGDNPQAYANDIILFDRKRGTGESIWDIKQKIGFVSPELHQYFPADNSCLQVVESGFYDTLGLFRPSQPKRAALALEWMHALEIDQFARALLKNIPASAQRLCLLARALIKNPALLIFDEPCQGMDDHQQRHFKNVVDAICAVSKVTLIYVTHYQHEIPDSVDKVLRLDKGEMVDYPADSTGVD